MDGTLTVAFHMFRAAASHLTSQQYAGIINITSRGQFGDVKASSCAAKAGIMGLAKALSLGRGAQGVTVNAVAPAFIDTKRLRALPCLAGMEERSKAVLPIKHFGSVDEVASRVCHLASAQTGFISGEVVHISGRRHGRAVH